MEVLNYVLVSLAVFSGLLVGWLVGVIAKEELKPGKKYLVLLKRFLFCAVFLIAAIFIVSSIWLTLVFIGALIYFFAGEYPLKDVVVYLLFGIVFYLSVERLFLLQASLMFIYGFPVGSLMYFEKKKIKDAFLRYAWFIPVAIVLFLVI